MKPAKTAKTETAAPAALTPGDDLRDALEHAAAQVRHCGDYGCCYFRPSDKTVWWDMADSDGDGEETDSQAAIAEHFLHVPGVRSVIFGNEEGQPSKPALAAGEWLPIPYDRKVNARRRKRERDEEANAEQDARASRYATGVYAPYAFAYDSMDSMASGEEEPDFLVADAAPVEILSGDAGPHGLLRVRQYAAQADVQNGNGRIYPRAVLEKACRDAQSHAQCGAMLSEMHHPHVASVPAPKGHRGMTGDEHVGGNIDAYVDNGPEQKTARVDAIYPPDADGRVYIDRTILDTPRGREVAARIKAGNPYGISTRFTMRGKRQPIGGQNVLVASDMKILTWDDVNNPAVVGAGRFELLSDALLEELQETLPVSPTSEAQLHDDAPTTPRNAERSRGEGSPMKEKVQAKISRLYALTASRASQSEIAALRAELGSDVLAAASDAESATDARELSRELLRYDAEVAASTGFNADKPGPAMVGPRDNGATGFAPDVQVGALPTAAPTVKQNPSQMSASGDEDGKDKPEGEKPADAKPDPEFDPEDADTLKQIAEDSRKEKAEKARTFAINAACDSLLVSHEGIKGLAPQYRDHVLGRVKSRAQTAADVEVIATDEVEALGKVISHERLKATGVTNGAQGNTVNDPASGLAYDTNNRPPAYMEEVEKLLAAGDEYQRRSSGFNPDSTEVRTRRKFNRTIVDGIAREYAARHKQAGTVQEWFAKNDSLSTGGERAFGDACERAASDAISTSSLWNQPTVVMTMLYQQFQDMKMLQFAGAIGPGLEGQSPYGGWSLTGTPGDGRVGSVLRLPVEYYVTPTGYGASGPQWDGGLAVPENTGIDEGEVRTTWLSFAPMWRRIATSLTSDAVRAMGNGPLNYAAVSRALLHISLDKSRRIDRALADEMWDVSDEYKSVRVQNESVNLANNSVHNGAGAVKVNLNPTKIASATVVAGDPFVQYGTNAIAVVRLKCAGSGTASPYFGTAAGTGSNPLVRTRRTMDLTGAGTATTVTRFPITIGSEYEGYLDTDGSVRTKPGAPNTATFAVDYNNGTIVYSSDSTVTGSAGILTSAVTVGEYWYATNFDEFAVTNPNIPTGVTTQQYYDSLLAQVDRTAALMGSAPRFVPPDLCLASLNASTFITQAQIFAPLLSPKGTELYPTQDFYATRNGIDYARTNTPHRVGDRRLLLSRRGSTKYAIDTPFFIDGPHQAYDSTGRPVDKKVYFGSENSVIGTPQVTDQAGDIKNPVSRTVLLR